ncbi:cdc42 effector protein 1 [Alligator sinensis]|uniref:Cdc42 effector protein 1 n=1 Tax=Alligator sinensis TaxID=38654 RepID=A0A3Q0GWV5_ALLSI|nr:cdc42 effector protein 1 [Alligator sinensis]
MSLGKLPVISWVSGSHGKRRLKSELTPDMISPPLGDFRHTMHVGRGGDVFGDTSFLSNHGGTNTPKGNSFFARTLRHVRRTPLRNRGSGGKTEASPAPPDISPIIKNAVSLPQLNEGTYGDGDGLIGKYAFTSSPNSLSETHRTYGLASGFCTIPRVPRSEKTQDNSCPMEPELTRSDSLLSFRLDLGPSLMSELFHVISFSEAGSKRQETEEDCALARGWAASPLHLHGEGSEDALPRGLGVPHTDHIDGNTASSLWGPSRQEGSLSEASSPLGLSVCANGEAHAIQHAEEGPAYAGGQNQSPGWESEPSEGAGAPLRETPWQGHQHDCGMGAGEFNRAAQMLACHYGGTSTRRSLEEEEEEEEEDPQVARTQASWESPSSSYWQVKAAVERCSPEAAWSQGEEEVEEEEVELSSMQEVDAVTSEGCSDSFEYANEEEEDDEVKV